MSESAAGERGSPERHASGLVLTGIDGLDELLGGGVPRGHTVTVLGSFGTGKTTFGIQFLVQGLINQEKGIFISLEEDPDSIVASAAGFGWDLATPLKEKRLAIVKLEPADARTTVMKVRSELPDRKSTRLDSSHLVISYAVFCLKKKHIDVHVD